MYNRDRDENRIFVLILKANYFKKKNTELNFMIMYIYQCHFIENQNEKRRSDKIRVLVNLFQTKLRSEKNCDFKDLFVYGNFLTKFKTSS